jgi:hypothetical protein
MSRQVERGAGRTHPSRLETLITRRTFVKKTEFRDKFFHKNNNRDTHARVE